MPLPRDAPSDARDSHDALFAGTLLLRQPPRGQGYRVNVDAVLLADFAGRRRRAKLLLDLGAGVGAVGLCLLYRDRTERVVLVERDPDLSRLSLANLVANGWRARGEARVADVTRVAALPPAVADLVVCNPPYVAPGRGRAPVVGAHARMGDLSGFLRAARHVLAARGRACFVYPANNLVALFEGLRAAGLEPKRARFVHAEASRTARVVLVEGSPGKRGGLMIEPPLVERDESGLSADLRAILEPAGP